MKINTTTIKTKQFLKLHILKDRIYENSSKDTIDDLSSTIDTSEILIQLKKTIQIIFKFHKNKKRILFVGLPKRIEKQINIKTNHFSIPKFFNIFGLFVNKSMLKSMKFKYYLLKKKKTIIFSKLLYKPDLIVIFDSKNYNAIIKESYQFKIPIILMNSKFYTNKKDKLNLYNVPGNFKFNKTI